MVLILPTVFAATHRWGASNAPSLFARATKKLNWTRYLLMLSSFAASTRCQSMTDAFSLLMSSFRTRKPRTQSFLMTK